MEAKMNSEEIAGMEVVDEILAEEYDDEAFEDAYERYRDDWTEKLEEDVKALFHKFYDAKNGYYSKSKERLVEHIINELADEAKVKVTAFEDVIVTAKNE
jgi:hypothetical protein